MHEKRSIIQQIIKAVNLQFSNKLCEKEAILEIKIAMLFPGVLAQAGLVQTLDKQISRRHLRTDSIFPESKLKNDMFFPDRLAIKNMIFQT